MIFHQGQTHPLPRHLYQSCLKNQMNHIPELKLKHYSLLQSTMSHRSKANAGCLLPWIKSTITLWESHIPLPNIPQQRNHNWDFLTIWKTKFSQKQIQNVSWYMWNFRLTVLQNHHSNSIRTRCLWGIKISYDIFDYLESYRDIVRF